MTRSLRPATPAGSPVPAPDLTAPSQADPARTPAAPAAVSPALAPSTAPSTSAARLAGDATARLAGDVSGDATSSLRIEHLALDALAPWPKNARTHSRKQVRQIADSIATFGFTAPVLVDEAGTILAGHGRVEAARLLGMERVPCVRLEHLTPAQRRAYVLADNKLAQGAGWDEELLGEELAALLAEGTRGFDLAVTGFSVAEVDALVEGLAVEEEGDPREDARDRAGEAPRRVEPGDVWQMGPHRLVCGDALDADVVARLMSGPDEAAPELARMVFTDPPYNVPIDGHVITRKSAAKGKGRRARAGEAAGEAADGVGTDGQHEGVPSEAPASRPAPRHREFAMAAGEMSREAFTAFLARAMRLLAAHTLDGSIHFVCMDWRHMGEMLEAGQGVYGPPKNLIVWAKDNGGMGSFYRSRHELVFAFKKGEAPHVNTFELGQHGRYRTNVWEYQGVNTRRAGRLNELALHPTVKPVQMIADAIRDVSGRGEIVLDLFGGSGSTLIAAHKTGRRARLVEIDPLYCDAILARWEAYAHGEAQLVERARTEGPN